jgi:hypothetical protein
MTYMGTVIDEMFATVERAEVGTHVANDVQELETWYAASHTDVASYEPALLGVA